MSKNCECCGGTGDAYGAGCLMCLETGLSVGRDVIVGAHARYIEISETKFNMINQRGTQVGATEGGFSVKDVDGKTYFYDNDDKSFWLVLED